MQLTVLHTKQGIIVNCSRQSLLYYVEKLVDNDSKTTQLTHLI
jgi:hypothetical protein